MALVVCLEVLAVVVAVGVVVQHLVVTEHQAKVLLVVLDKSIIKDQIGLVAVVVQEGQDLLGQQVATVA
jgi:hypothetical protein